MIHVLASICTKPGKRDEFLSIFRSLVPEVRAEDGCIEYVVTTDAETGIDAQTMLGENSVMVVEKWASADALKAHLVAPHMTTFRERTAEMVEDVSINIVRPRDSE